jgi:hypothetical protein
LPLAATKGTACTQRIGGSRGQTLRTITHTDEGRFSYVELGAQISTHVVGRLFAHTVDDLARWSAEDIGAVATALNNRPHTTLGWKTPHEAVNEQ